MANHAGSGRNLGRDDDERYRMRDDDERFDRDERWIGRGASPWGAERFVQREYGRGGWDQARASAPQGYVQDGDRGSFERGAARSGLAAYEPGLSGRTPRNGVPIVPARRGPHRGKGPQGFVRSDERVRELVCEALTDDDDVDATSIEVIVKNGEVMLGGTVEDREMKRRAEDCVERVPGVRDVHNQLRIRS